MAWPYDIARIQWDTYQTLADPAYERTPFEDGAIRQARVRSLPYEVSRFDFLVRVPDLPAFRAWRDGEGRGSFDFRDPGAGDMDRTVRIPGGPTSITLQGIGGVRLRGAPVMRGSVELEGFWT